MSRLDRLVTLIETGSTPFIRNTAADQLSSLAKQHPEDILNLLSRVYPFLLNKKWETRVTAARALGGIISFAPQWDPNCDDSMNTKLEHQDEGPFAAGKEELNGNGDAVHVKNEIDDDAILDKLLNNFENRLVTLDDFDLSEILKSHIVLLASSGAEYNLDNPGSNLKKRKTEFTTKLGLDDIKKKLQHVSDIQVKKEDDLENMSKSPSQSRSSTSSRESSISPLTPAKPHMSARMRALAKRRARFAKSHSHRNENVDLTRSSVSEELSESKEFEVVSKKKNETAYDVTTQSDENKLCIENKVKTPALLNETSKYSGYVWQFQGLYELLVNDLFNEVWEIRHGCAMGLRELIKYQAKGAGRVKGKTRKENDYRNEKTLEDLCVRLITLFALDRFGDYVSDTVVAPVRENSGQALAALLLHLSDETVLRTFDILLSLIKQDIATLGIQIPCWQVKHGGILGLKYFVSVRTDMLFKHPTIMDRTIDTVLYCLRDDSDDDVQSMAAATLIPITAEFVNLKLDKVFEVLDAIWNNLSSTRDDLSASTGSIMDLLAKLCLHKEVLERMKELAGQNEKYDFKFLVPKLYPFFRHSIINVRKSVLKTLFAFLSIDDDSTKGWINDKAFRFVFQNILMEQNDDVSELSMKVYVTMLSEVAKGSHGSMEDIFKDNWYPLLKLMTTPLGIARFNYSMDPTYILRPSGSTMSSSDIQLTGFNIGKHHGHKRKFPTPSDDSQKKTSSGIPDTEYDLHVNIDAPIINGDLTLVSKEVLLRTRLICAEAMGKTIAHYTSEEALEDVCKQITVDLQDFHSTSRLIASIIVDNYCSTCSELGKQPADIAVKTFGDIFWSKLSDPSLLPSFRESVPTLKGLRTQCLQLFGVFSDVGKVSSSKLPTLPVIVEGEKDAGPNAFGISTAEKVVNQWYKKIYNSMSALYRISSVKPLGDARHRIKMAILDAKSSAELVNISILASYASCYIKLCGLPKKLNPVIRAVMDSIKREESPQLQAKSADFAAYLISFLHEKGKLGASDKMTKNLCAFMCVDTSEVPEFIPNKGLRDAVLSLKKEDADDTDSAQSTIVRKEVYQAKIKRRGGIMALKRLLRKYKADLFNKLPKIKLMMLDALKIFEKGPDYQPTDEEGQAAIDSLELIRSLIGELDQSLYPELFDKADLILDALQSKYSVFRYSASKCFGSVCAIAPGLGFRKLVRSVLPLLNNALEVTNRQGAMEAVYHITNLMGASILPYVIFLIVPVMGRMSDSNNGIRMLATKSFASIIKLVPLEAGIPDPPDMPEDLLEGREKERKFIQQMMDPTKIEPFKLPVSIHATLRKYQQDGVSWLAFLNRYHLHGILCDDMGLGKTLQTICIVASDHHIRAEKFKETGSPEFKRISSLIVCPPSLTGHWEQEFARFAPFMSVLVYAGPPAIRSQLRAGMSKYDVIVTSYDVVRNDCEYMTQKNYNYCVLDEGHIIRNAHTRLTISVKKVKSEHRLILTGTPIQNNVLELWSLFDFLMPGFLGTEKAFNDKFVKPISTSRTSKGSKDQEAGALALETLHKQVLPFMLRRLKEDVLSDLPPKIIQDYYCELSSLQKQLYHDFISKQKGSVKKDISTSNQGGKKHIFQVLQYMRKLCNSPALVVTPNHPQYNDVKSYLGKYNMDLRDIHYAPKLMALKNLLKECGIGLSGNSSSKNQAHDVLQDNVISQHRALIFCQMRDMLDIVENDLLKKHMPDVTYLRMDGSTDPRYRQQIVSKFNGDPSIDVLLLTTKVGGLGLNLTGADTVIFVEHDWNPMNDLQAMDRAHRIGQKKVVNVYRLITKGTLEEKIMGLQKFKLNIANTVVNQQNAGLSSMNSNQLLDLFGEDAEKATKGDKSDQEEAEEGEEPDDTQETSNKGPDDRNVPNEVGLSGKAGKAVTSLGKLWDESQYEEEYNLDSFLKTLK
ncbi:hypothetical protein BRETT_001094 [Brettanomyces bruxellensis]|uniref:TATA-binding protein-associated factor mot1 n=1 Tax=Dekkera bruxellensis TaxID=5007 RepID=A0A871REC1_DEKBR|nr:uncharacterized protein BRETT_001094 [Brettanomyces bruxellensis]QOU21372.1 hypothetical protein BRETT_001094 [Brettanomyces bruxellensis]